MTRPRITSIDLMRAVGGIFEGPSIGLVAARVKVGRDPGFPVFSPDSAKLYVMNSGEGDVAIVDLKEMKVVARHYVGVNPFGGGLRTR
jgi:YVTN family beta-propeller protein